LHAISPLGGRKDQEAPQGPGPPRTDEKKKEEYLPKQRGGKKKKSSRGVPSKPKHPNVFRRASGKEGEKKTKQKSEPAKEGREGRRQGSRGGRRPGSAARPKNDWKRKTSDPPDGPRYKR